MKCARCGRTIREPEYLEVDGEITCRRCLHGEAQPFRFYPIGYVHTEAHGDLKRLELLPPMQQFMYGLAEEEYLTVVYLLHQARGVHSVFRRGLDGKEVGIFASRSPGRINPLAITEVELVRVEGTTLFVHGLDALDGSPILDIKLGRKAMQC